jgi:hypothetical protein
MAFLETPQQDRDLSILRSEASLSVTVQSSLQGFCKLTMMAFRETQEQDRDLSRTLHSALLQLSLGQEGRASKPILWSSCSLHVS